MGDSAGMITTRPAIEMDLPFVEGVFLQAMRDHITATRGSWNETMERSQFREQLRLDHTRIIELDGTSVGFFMVLERAEDLELHTICIAPQYQRRGLGTRVIRQIIADADDQRRSVQLSVLKANTEARSLYERLGFVVTGETTHHYHMRLVS